MTAKERNELLYALLQDYVLAKNNSKVWQRERPDWLSSARGKLVGACMALELDIIETAEYCTICTRRGKKVVRYEIKI